MSKTSSIIILAVAAVGIYLLYKFSDSFIGGLFKDGIAGALGDVGRGITQGAEVGGLRGAIGGGIYESVTGHTETLRERIVERIGITGEDYTEAGVHEVAEDIHKAPFDAGFIGAIIPPFSGFTIGAGIATIQKWGEWLKTLSPEERRVARWGEYEQRTEWMKDNPIQTLIGFPAALYSGLTHPRRDLREFPTPELLERTKIEPTGTPYLPTVFQMASRSEAEEVAQARYYAEVAPTHEPIPKRIIVTIDKSPKDIQPLPPPQPAPQDVIYEPKVRAIGTAEQIADKYGDF